MDLEQQLRETYAERLDHLDMTGGDVAAARRTGARLRLRRRMAVGVGAVAVVAVAVGGSLLGTGRVSVGPSQDGGEWRELPAAPLSPRANAQAVWTGREVIVLGGETDPCPPGADCAVSENDLRDGAAYDPRTNTWRSIPPAPVPVGPGDRLVLADGVVVLRHWQEHGSSWFTYQPDHNRWTPIDDVPPGIGDLPSAIGSKVYALTGRQVAVYDVTTLRWTLLPPDDLEPALAQRRVTATDAGPVVTGVDSSEPQDGSGGKPLLILADVWDGNRWRRLPPSEQLADNEFTWTGTRMVDPEPFTLNGGQVDGWGRSYPMGGTLDPSTGTWGPLPSALVSPPQGEGQGWGVSAAGGPWFAVLGQAYDDATGRIFHLDPPSDAPDYGMSAAWAGDRLVVFGGAGQGVTQPVELSDGAWMWTP
jgi:hypothetical protein